MWLSTLSHSLTSVFIKEIKTILFWKDERYVPCLTVLIQSIVGPVELYKKKKNKFESLGTLVWPWFCGTTSRASHQIS